MTQNLGSTSNPLSMTGEQWVLEERTDDPLSPEPGECWIRTDLNAGDKIATLKFGDGSEVPIFPTGTSEPGVLEVRRVQTGGQTGYLPVADLDFATFPQLRLQHNNTVYSLHDDIEPGAIPNSVVHHYDATEESGSSTWVDLVGNDDLSAIGSPSLVSQGINGLQSFDFDGSSDAFEATLSSAIQQDFAVFAVIELQDTSSKSRFVGDSENNNHPAIQNFDNELSWGFSITNSGVSPDTNPHIYTLVYGSGQTKEFRIDGSVVKTDSDLEEDITNIDVGYRPSDNDRFTDMLAGEIIYDASVDNVSDEESRLSDKWGISI